tara:strand:+ start:22298 stop:25438 length:3141 start_codon:yes stop_codon:yes gene_type:complete
MLTIVGMLFLFGQPSTVAQDVEVRRTHAISTPHAQLNTLPATGTLNVVAIMVEFEADENRLTSGTGVFGSDGTEGLPYLTREENTFVDPLPHDRNYFEAHLEFAKNYFERSSDGQLMIDYQVLPTIYTLDNPMETYSPIGETFTTEKLAVFLQDVWTTVEENGGFDATGLDPDNTAFVVFHAGVGRDVELTGTSLDITPFDIPSIYMREQDLEQWLGNDFDGFTINNGSFFVKNSMIIPRTESRRGEDITESEIVFPLSINGLLCASIGSYLGLPDLFNTETGEPAIGRFGLMDGAGFFAYNGLLPPEPSAWEKVFLGWETPITITDETAGDVLLPAASLSQPNSIVKYSLSSTEYFLIENRHRDPDGTGIVITTRQPNGTIVQKTFTNDDDVFIFQEAGFDTLLDSGTFIDVSNFDWSLPGGLDIGLDEREGTADDRELNGGILIWHIDEAVINRQLESGRVNVDPLRRGIDLEEADGAQDIGRDVGLLDNSSSFGYAFDFWWSGNNYRVITQTGTETFYNNTFGPASTPNNNSNSGAKSFFELYDFSDNLPTASFKVRPAESSDFGFELLFSTDKTRYDRYFTENDVYFDLFPLSLTLHETLTDTFVVAPTQSLTYAFDTSNPIEPDYHLGLYRRQPLSTDLLILGSSPVIINPARINAYDLDRALPGTNVWETQTTTYNGFLSSQDGVTIDLDFSNTSINASDGAQTQNTSGYEFRSEIVNGKFVGINGNTVSYVGEDIDDYMSDASDRLFAGTIKTNGSNLYYLFEDGTFTIVNPQSEEPFTQIFEEEKAEWPAIVDEGYIYRVNKTENTIEGYNLNGAMLSNFPLFAPDSIQFIGTPLIADITGDNIQDIIVIGQDNYSVNIFAYETTGNPIDGFPLYVGGSVGKDTQPIHPVFFEDKLYAISHTGDLKGWEFQNFTSSQWPARYGKNPYNKVSADITISETQGISFSVLNLAETYNWPNPANNSTNLRFELESPGGTIEVTIIDYTGRIIFERTVQTKGGAPEEISISTQEWSSGAYFARLKATVGNRSESKVVKIGVAH